MKDLQFEIFLVWGYSWKKMGDFGDIKDLDALKVIMEEMMASKGLWMNSSKFSLNMEITW